MQEKTPAGIWIGGTDQDEEGNWTWTDCSPWDFTRWGVREDVQQPDNSRFGDGDGENCALFPGNKASTEDWADVACNLKGRQFVCSKPICPKGLKVDPYIFLTDLFLKELLLLEQLWPVPLSALF